MTTQAFGSQRFGIAKRTTYGLFRMRPLRSLSLKQCPISTEVNYLARNSTRCLALGSHNREQNISQLTTIREMERQAANGETDLLGNHVARRLHSG